MQTQQYTTNHLLFFPKVLSVVLAIGGVVLFAYSDGFTAANIEGVLLTLGAAIGAAVYKVREERGGKSKGRLFCVGRGYVSLASPRCSSVAQQ